MVNGALILPPFKYRKKKKVYRASEKIISMNIIWKLYFTGLAHDSLVREQRGINVFLTKKYLPRKSYGFSFVITLSEQELDLLKDSKFEKSMDEYIEELINPVFYGCISYREEYFNGLTNIVNPYTSKSLSYNFDYIALCHSVLSILKKFEEEGYSKENLEFDSLKGIEVPTIKTRLDEWWEWVYV